MGTNYFSVRRGVEHLSPDEFWSLRDEFSDDVLHIGKSSGGWCFSLHVMPERGINDLWDWIDFFLDPGRIIIDEYRDVITASEMFKKITQRGRPNHNNWDSDMMQKNYAEPGPSNLVRHQLGHGCVKHGIGTWDCVEGRFS